MNTVESKLFRGHFDSVMHRRQNRHVVYISDRDTVKILKQGHDLTYIRYSRAVFKEQTTFVCHSLLTLLARFIG